MCLLRQLFTKVDTAIRGVLLIASYSFTLSRSRTVTDKKHQVHIPEIIYIAEFFLRLRKPIHQHRFSYECSGAGLAIAYPHSSCRLRLQWHISREHQLHALVVPGPHRRRRSLCAACGYLAVLTLLGWANPGLRAFREKENPYARLSSPSAATGLASLPGLVLSHKILTLLSLLASIHVSRRGLQHPKSRTFSLMIIPTVIAHVQLSYIV